MKDIQTSTKVYFLKFVALILAWYSCINERENFCCFSHLYITLLLSYVISSVTPISSHILFTLYTTVVQFKINPFYFLCVLLLKFITITELLLFTPIMSITYMTKSIPPVSTGKISYSKVNSALVSSFVDTSINPLC